MNTFVIVTLIATVSAEAGYACVQPTTGTEWDTSSSTQPITDAITPAECKAACDTVATADTSKDWCCFLNTETESLPDEGDFSYDCALWSLDHQAGASIK